MFRVFCRDYPSTPSVDRLTHLGPAVSRPPAIPSTAQNYHQLSVRGANHRKDLGWDSSPVNFFDDLLGTKEDTKSS